MGIQSLIQRLAGRQSERKQAAVLSYREMVYQIAEGQEPSVDAVEQTLRDSGKSVDDFRKDTAQVLARREWRRILADEPDLHEKRAELEELRVAAEKKLNEQIETGRAAIAQIENEQAALQERLSAIAEARGSLMRPAVAPDNYRTLQQERSAATQRLQSIENEEVAARIRAAHIYNSPEQTKSAQTAHAAILRRKAQAESQVSELRSRIDDIEDSLLCQ